MPGLVVFGRRWSIGSDDLIVPACGLAFLNVVWIISLTSIVTQTLVHRDEYALCAENFVWYPGATIALQATLLVLHVSIAAVSGSGAVFDKTTRRSLPALCYVRTVLMLLEVVWSCVGCVLIDRKLKREECHKGDQLYILMCVVVGTNLIVFFLTLLTMYMCFDSAGKTFRKLQYLNKTGNKNGIGSRGLGYSDCAAGEPGQSDSENAEMITSLEGHRQEILALTSKLQSKYREKWQERVKSAFCCQTKSNDKEAFKQIGLLLAGYLEHLDLVLSDLIVGMMILRKHQRALFKETIQQPTNDVYQYLSGMAISPRTKFLTLKDDHTQCEFSCMTHFMQYAVASYGWQGQCFFYPGKACCRLNICGRCAGCPRHRPTVTLHGDNCCQCDYTAIRTGSPLIDEDDFVYGNYENESEVPSYYVCLDHEYKKVLLCIRGTMSFTDALIDLQGESEEIKVNPAQTTWHAHMGMLAAALNIIEELSQTKALDSAFTRCKTTGYSLLVIGHSLGAGVAAIIAFLLREQYPNLYCYSFSPPGGLLSPEAMEESKKFITSVVVGKDIIPRLGLAQLEYLRSDLLSLLETSQTPKWRILASTLPLIRRCLRQDPEGTLPRSRSQNYNPFQSRALSSSHKPMFMPGRVIHIVKNYPKEGSKSKEPLYQAIWADNSMFDQIIVSPSMFDDHMPNHVYDAMQQVLSNHGPKKPCKTLTEQERQAILHIEEETTPDRHSNGSGLSWEYTCQSEATVALKSSPVSEGVTTFAPPTLLPVTSNGGVDTPTQWMPAPLASQEDLLSIRQSTPSLTSHRGLSDISCSNTLPKRSKSLSSAASSLRRVSRKSSQRSTPSDKESNQSAPLIPPVIRQSVSANSPRWAPEESADLTNQTHGVHNPNLHSPNHLSEPYIAHRGKSNQVEYSSTINGHQPQGGSGGFLHTPTTTDKSENHVNSNHNPT